jgi:hypothetical protein
MLLSPSQLPQELFMLEYANKSMPAASRPAQNRLQTALLLKKQSPSPYLVKGTLCILSSSFLPTGRIK